MMIYKKTVLEVAPVFLKKNKRIEAMLFLYFAALMKVSLIERKIRMNMEKEIIEKIGILPQGMNTQKANMEQYPIFFSKCALFGDLSGWHMHTRNCKRTQRPA